MASIKVKYRPSSVSIKDGAIYYQIIHHRVPRQIATDYRIRPCEWDEKRSIVIATEKNRETFIKSIRQRIRWDLERLDRIISKLSTGLLDFTT